MATTSTASSIPVPDGSGLKAATLQHLLREKIAVLAGGRDREGRPIICFPSRKDAERSTAEDIRLVLAYLHSIPSDEVRQRSFVILIDMRSGMGWGPVKTILRTLQDHFPGTVHAVYILKPERFWDKHKANLAVGKWRLEVELVTTEQLERQVDKAQVPEDLDGTLAYDHDEWIELRTVLEGLIWRALDELRDLDAIREELENGPMPVDVESAREALDAHAKLKRRIASAKVEDLEREGATLIGRLRPDKRHSHSDYGSASAPGVAGNPDFANSAPHISSLLSNLRQTRSGLHDKAVTRKARLDQCFQLKLFEKDAETMFAWIKQHVELFLAAFADIGTDAESAKRAQAEHEEFSRAARNTHVNMEHIARAAERLLDSAHYASQRIAAVSGRLKADWDVFTRALDTRGAVLALSLTFHYKAEAFLLRAQDWKAQCECSGDAELAQAAAARPDDAPALVPSIETAVQRHQALCDAFTHHYSEVHGLSKDLLRQLSLLVEECLGEDDVRIAHPHPQEHHQHHQHQEDQPPVLAVCEGRALVETLKSGEDLAGLPTARSTNAATSAGYTAAANHVLHLIQQLAGRQRDLETAWDARSVRLHTRLTLLLFQQDVIQVFEWLDNHGDKFLRKNVGIGKTLTRAKQLQESQEEFEKIAKMTYTNAESLLTAANELAGRGEVDPAEVFSVSERLERRIKAFAARVAERRLILSLSVLLHTHQKEMLSWYGKEKAKAAEVLVVAADMGRCEGRQEAWLKNEEETRTAYKTVRQEGQQLVQLLRREATREGVDNAEWLALVEGVLAEVEAGQADLDRSRPQQRAALNLGANFRLFEQDCRIILDQLGGWKDDMRHMLSTLTPDRAESILPLHQDNTSQVMTAQEEIALMAAQHLGALEKSGLQLRTVEGELVVDRIRALDAAVKEGVQEVMSMARSNEKTLEENLKLEQRFRRFQDMAGELHVVIENEDRLLRANRFMPSSHEEATRLKEDHDVFNKSINQYNAKFAALEQRAEEIRKSENEYTGENARAIMTELIGRWKTLVGQAEQLGRFFVAAEAFYKSTGYIFPLLDHLMTTFDSGQDACGKYKAGLGCWKNAEGEVLNFVELAGKSYRPDAAVGEPAPIRDKSDYTLHLLAHHAGYKTKVQQSCSYATNSCSSLIRQIQAIFGRNTREETQVLEQLELLRRQEPEFLRLWTQRNQLLKSCHRYVQIESQAKDALQFLHQEAETWLNQHPLVSKGDKVAAEKLLADMAAFKEQRVTAEKVKVQELVGKCRGELEAKDSSSFHQAEVQQWLDTVEERYTDLSSRMDKLEARASLAAGRPLPKHPPSASEPSSLSPAASSSPAPTADHPPLLPSTATASDSKRASAARKKDLVMAEILKTEQDYVRDLEELMELYMTPLDSKQAPASLRAHKDTIFSNLQQLHHFHKNEFLKELQDYIDIPEDVGHCFISWQHRFQLYVSYCRNKEHSNQLLTSPEAQEFFKGVKEKSGLDSSKDIEWYLIKPVQRITKYGLLLQQLLSACPEGGEGAEIAEAAEVIASVPRRANDLIHFAALNGFPDKDSLGEILLQEALTVWEPRPKGQLLNKKGRERQVFLFDFCLVFAKKEHGADDSHSANPGLPNNKRLRYSFKTRLMVSEINVTEHMEGDECKFAVWTGLVPTNESRTVLKASDYKTKVLWVKRLRDLISQRILHLNLPGSLGLEARGSWTEEGSASLGDSAGRDREWDERSASSRGDRRSLHSLGSNLDTELTHKMLIKEGSS